MLREKKKKKEKKKVRNSERKNNIIRLCKTKRVLVSIVERIKGSKKRARRSAEGDRVWKLVPQSSARWQERLVPSLRAAHGHLQGFTPETLVSPPIDSSWHVFKKRRRPMSIQKFSTKRAACNGDASKPRLAIQFVSQYSTPRKSGDPVGKLTVPHTCSLLLQMLFCCCCQYCLWDQRKVFDLSASERWRERKRKGRGRERRKGN